MAYDPSQYQQVTTAKDVTEEVMETAWGIIEGWYLYTPIDWDDVWDRLDGTPLDSGLRIDMGGQTDTPAMRKIVREMRKRKAESQ